MKHDNFLKHYFDYKNLLFDISSTNKKWIVLMRGIPRLGKSTAANKFTNLVGVKLNIKACIFSGDEHRYNRFLSIKLFLYKLRNSTYKKFPHNFVLFLLYYYKKISKTSRYLWGSEKVLFGHKFYTLRKKILSRLLTRLDLEYAIRKETDLIIIDKLHLRGYDMRDWIDLGIRNSYRVVALLPPAKQRKYNGGSITLYHASAKDIDFNLNFLLSEEYLKNRKKDKYSVSKKLLEICIDQFEYPVKINK